MIETHRLENMVICIQKILGFVLCCQEKYTLLCHKWCKFIWKAKNKGIFATFFKTENRRLDRETAKVENLKT